MMPELLQCTALYQNSVLVAVVVVASASVVLFIWLGPARNSSKPLNAYFFFNDRQTITEETDIRWPTISSAIATTSVSEAGSDTAGKSKRSKERRKRAKEKDRATNRALLAAQVVRAGSPSSSASKSPARREASLLPKAGPEPEEPQASFRNSQHAPCQPRESDEPPTPTIHHHVMRVSSPSPSEATTATNTTGITVQSSTLLLTPPIGQGVAIPELNGDLQLELTPSDDIAPEDTQNTQKGNLTLRAEATELASENVHAQTDSDLDREDWVNLRTPDLPSHLQTSQPFMSRVTLPPQPPSPPPPKNTSTTRTSSKNKARRAKDRQKSPNPSSSVEASGSSDLAPHSVELNDDILPKKRAPSRGFSAHSRSSSMSTDPTAMSMQAPSPRRAREHHAQLPPRHRKQGRAPSSYINIPTTRDHPQMSASSSPSIRGVQALPGLSADYISPPVSPHAIPSPYLHYPMGTHPYAFPQLATVLPQPLQIFGHPLPPGYYPVPVNVMSGLPYHDPRTSLHFGQNVAIPQAMAGESPLTDEPLDMARLPGSFADIPLHDDPSSSSRSHSATEELKGGFRTDDMTDDHPSSPNGNSSPEEIQFPTLNPSKLERAESRGELDYLPMEPEKESQVGDGDAPPFQLESDSFGWHNLAGSHAPLSVSGGSYPAIPPFPQVEGHMTYQISQSHQRVATAPVPRPSLTSWQLHRLSVSDSSSFQLHSPPSPRGPTLNSMLYASGPSSPILGSPLKGQSSKNRNKPNNQVKEKDGGDGRKASSKGGDTRSVALNGGAELLRDTGSLESKIEDWNARAQHDIQDLSEDLGRRDSPTDNRPSSSTRRLKKSRSRTSSGSSNKPATSSNRSNRHSPSPNPDPQNTQGDPTLSRLRTASGNHLATMPQTPLARQSSTPSLTPNTPYYAGPSPLSLQGHHPTPPFSSSFQASSPHRSFPPHTFPIVAPISPLPLPHNQSTGVLSHTTGEFPVPHEYSGSGSPRRPSSRATSSNYGSASSRSGSPRVFTHALPHGGQGPHVAAGGVTPGFRPSLPPLGSMAGYPVLPSTHPLASPLSTQPAAHYHLLFSGQHPQSYRGRQDSGSALGSGKEENGSSETQEKLDVSDRLMEAIFKNPEAMKSGQVPLGKLGALTHASKEDGGGERSHPTDSGHGSNDTNESHAVAA